MWENLTLLNQTNSFEKKLFWNIEIPAKPIEKKILRKGKY